VWGLGFLGGAVLPGIEFESPIPPKKGGQKTERVIYTVPSGPPEDSFKSSMLQIPACKSLIGLMFFNLIAAGF
jgi:hypothetical protein